MAGQAWDPKAGRGYSLQGGRWVYDPAVKPPTGLVGSPVGGGGRGGSRSGQSQEEQKKLNKLDEEAGAAYETHQQYGQVRDAMKRLKPGPFRGAMLDAAIPTEQTGPLGRLAATVLSPVTRWTGAISDQNVKDYQRVKGIQSKRVLNTQLEQKGVQTEGDARRMQMTDISPNQTLDTNLQVINSAEQAANRVQARAPFYTAWANKHGLNGLDEQGRSVEQAFQQSLKATPPPTPEGWSVVK